MSVLRIGKRGAAVRRWQLFLIGQEYQPGKADGIFGVRTEQATMAFQKKHDLEPDGVVGNRTYGQAMLLGFQMVEDPLDARQTGPNWPPRPGFSPIVSNRERQALLGKFQYKHAPMPGNYEHIKILGDWVKKNLVRVDIPQLAGMSGASKTGRLWFHRLAAAQLQKLFKAWEEAKLLDRLLSFEGAFVPRFIRGSTTTLSNHAFASAFDLNYSWNKIGHVPALGGEKGSLRELVPLANEFGFYWGGHYKGRLDGMHFEVAKIL